MIDILNITGEPIFDDRIIKTHTYNPFTNITFGWHKNTRTTTGFVHITMRKLVAKHGGF